MKIKSIYTLSILLFGLVSFAQTAKIKGLVLNVNNELVSDVSINVGNESTVTNQNGFYELLVPANQEIKIYYTHLGYQTVILSQYLQTNEDKELNIRFNQKSEQLAELVIDKNTKENVQGLTVISPRVIRLIPGANAGVENILKTLPGVYSNNELSTSYAVRGGNYDENLVYVNEIEVYRPFLIRSGQQEGLSFTNTAMVSNVDFSAGGFQAKYGDKLSSVLDITYRNPTKFKAQLEASLMGGSATVDLVSNNQKWSNISGIRYRNNALLVNTQDTKAQYDPRYVDFQTLVNFNASSKWQLSFLGSISSNVYHIEPETRVTNFGTIDNPVTLLIKYEGQELDKYQTYFGAFKAAFKPNENSIYKFIASAYHTKESEYYDILASYNLAEVDRNIGSDTFDEIKYTRGLGTQLNHGRNDYDALIASAEIKGQHNVNENKIEWGIRYVSEDIRDRLLEWEVIDSAGFSLAAPILDFKNNQPYSPDVYPLEPYQSVRATNYVKINRFNAFAQWSKLTQIGEHQVWLNAGVRTQLWNVDDNGETNKTQATISPRAQFTIKPNWNTDMLFRFAVGMYHQPPNYRELRAMDGTINADLKAQQSTHFVLGNDFSFKIDDIPFKLTSELYYKNLTNVNIYTLENVRIRYMADNLGTAYVYGADFRLHGELVPGSESWLSFGYLKTEENYNDRGYIARPTDQRLKFGLLFQDYMPAIPNLKLYLNLVYNTGLPGGSPTYADPYMYQSRLKDYRRVDAGFTYVFKDEGTNSNKKWLKGFDEVSLGFEIYNLFNNQNAITKTWVRDAYSKYMYGMPNYMTQRMINVKLNMRM
ncbi:TonB-dependent receptor plug domain-containing protein [Flavobacterium sp. I3-2]|uniref:TonB-dependent receptor n=1 Tax=Flavobacterium sp. I3-2 TaxID=2748319 RepID=UPI00293B9A97|nr:TonB-dependent receptor plug domain-containing protein [Flavobacterium sp. I3-2]